MAQLLDWLAEGDLRSDGLANEVVVVVLQSPELLEEVIAGLDVENDAVRGHAADALEKVGRQRPDLFIDHLERLMLAAQRDRVPMVRWHLAMLLGHMVSVLDQPGGIPSLLLKMLDDRSVFVRSWVITSLCIVSRRFPGETGPIIEKIEPLTRDSSIAIRTRATKALDLLVDARRPFPSGWIKMSDDSSLSQ